MANFFEGMPPDTAIRLEQLSRLAFQAREYRNAILAPYGVADEAALLEHVREGKADEHPAWEHYLAARILTDTREAARAMIASRAEEPPSVPIHLQLAALVEEEFSASLAAAPEQTLDALVVRLAGDLVLTVHYASADAYSLRWRRGEREAGIDTAPVHSGLATRPNHFHAAGGEILADPLTNPSRAPAENLRTLIRALLDASLPGLF